MERVTFVSGADQSGALTSGADRVTGQVGEAFLSLMQTYQFCMQRTLLKYGLYPGQPSLLFAIANEKAPTQNDLARILGVSKASVGVSLRRLEKAGFVKRERDAQDTRCIRIALTRRGAEYARFCRIDYDMIHASMLATMDQAEREQVLAMIEELHRGLLELKKRIQL